jgi:hypothetical protein
MYASRSARLGSAGQSWDRCGLIVATDFSARSPLWVQAANLGPMAVTLVAVVDFSGSMAGAKLRRVKDTLNYMIDNLSDQVGR